MKKLIVNLCFFLFLAGSTASAFSQRALVENSSSVTGTIDVINQDEKYIIINDSKFDFNDADVTVNYNGEQVDSIVLDSGQRISYRTRQDGSISEINLLSRLRLEQQPGNH